MSCKPTYKGKRYNSLDELLKFNNLSKKVFDNYKEFFPKAVTSNLDNFLIELPTLPFLSEDFIINTDKYINEYNEQQSINFAITLSEKLNIPFEVITQTEMSERFPNQPSRKNFYLSGKVYLVEGAINSGSVFHEFAHPIIKSMALENPDLFNALFAELSLTDSGINILSQLASDPHLKKDSSEFKEEAIVMSLQVDFEQTDVKAKGFFENLYFHIKQFLRKLLGKKINISKLNKKTTITEFVEMINQGDDFNLNLDYLNKDLIVMFQTEYNKIVTEVLNQNQIEEEVQKITDEMYQMVEEMLTQFNKDNDIYKKIEADLGGDVGAIKEVYDILRNITTYNINNSKITKSVSNLPKEVREFNNKIQNFVKALVSAKKILEVFNKKISDLKSEDLTSKDILEQIDAVGQYNKHFSATFSIWNPGEGSGIFAKTGSELKKLYDELETIINNNELQIIKLNIEVVTEGLYKILTKKLTTAQEELLDTINNGVNDIIKDKAYLEYYGISKEEFVEIETLKNKNNRTLDDNARLEFLQQKSYSGWHVTKESIKFGLLNNEEGNFLDINSFQSYADHQNLTISGLHAIIGSAWNEIEIKATDMESELLLGLKPLLQRAGYGLNMIAGDGQLGKDLGQINESAITEDNKKVKFLEWRFKNNFFNTDYELSVLSYAVKKAKDEVMYSRSDINLASLKVAEKNEQNFKNNYMHQDYVLAFYQLEEKYFTSSIGIKAKNAKNEAYQKVRLQQSLMEKDPYFLDSTAVDELWLEYKQLFQEHDENSIKKTGDALEIAKILTEHRNESATFYEWQSIPDAFENTVDAFKNELINKQNLIEGSDVYNQEMERWLDKNTIVSITQSYFDEKTAYRDTLQSFTFDLDAFNNLGDISQMYKDIFDILRPTKDNSNQYDVNDLNDASQQKVTDLSKQINQFHDKIITLSGATKEDMARYREIYIHYSNTGQFRDQEDEDFYDNFWELASLNLELDFNISPEDVAVIKALMKLLSDLSSTRLSKYYIAKFMSLVNETEESKEYFYDNVDLEELGDTPDEASLKDFFNDISKVEGLFAINSNFKTWFIRNHFTKNIDVYDDDGHFVENIDIFTQALGWNYTIPRKLEHFNLKAVGNMPIPADFQRDGYIYIDGVPRVPSINFMERVVKDEFKTEEIFEDYIDTNGELVLATKDNRGKWLPKDYTGFPETGAVDKKYIDESYKQMFKFQKNKFLLLDHLKKQYLKNQEKLDNSQKMYLSYPRQRAGDVQNITDGNRLSRWVINIRDSWWADATDDAETAAIKNKDKSKNLANYINITRPISGNFNLDINLVGTNIIKLMGTNAFSIAYFEKMRSVSSYVNMFTNVVDILNNPNINTLADMNNTAQLLSKNPLGKKTNLQAAVAAMSDKFISGEELQNSTAATRKINKVITQLQKFITRKSFSFDIDKSWTNFLGANQMIIIKSTEGRHFTSANWVASAKITGKVILDMITSGYTQNPMSLELQFVNMMGGIPNNLKQNIGERASKSLAQSWIAGDVRYWDRRTLASAVNVQLFFAIVKNKTFMMNGKKTNLLEQIELVDGKVQTKPGVPEEWEISFDSSGNRKVGAKVKFIKNLNATLANKTIGMNNQLNEGEAYRNAYIKLFTFLTKFFVKIALDYTAVRMKKGKFGNKRLNLNTEDLEHGRYIANLSLIGRMVDLIKGGGLTKLFDKKSKLLTWQQKAAIKSTLTYVLFYLFQNVFLGWFGFDWDDNDEFPLDDFKYDKEKEDNQKHISMVNPPMEPVDLVFDLVLGKYSPERSAIGNHNWFSVLNESSQNHPNKFDLYKWAKLHALVIAQKTNYELRTFSPGGVVKNTNNLIFGKSPMNDGSAIGAILDVMYILSEEEVYEQKSGVYKGEDVGDSKAWKIAIDWFGLSGDVLNPEQALEKANRKY